jgi:hypothetical protein
LSFQLFNRDVHDVFNGKLFLHHKYTFQKILLHLKCTSKPVSDFFHAVSSLRNPRGIVTFMVHIHSLLSIKKKKTNGRPTHNLNLTHT